MVPFAVRLQIFSLTELRVGFLETLPPLSETRGQRRKKRVKYERESERGSLARRRFGLAMENNSKLVPT